MIRGFHGRAPKLNFWPESEGQKLCQRALANPSADTSEIKTWGNPL